MPAIGDDDRRALGGGDILALVRVAGAADAEAGRRPAEAERRPGPGRSSSRSSVSAAGGAGAAASVRRDRSAAGGSSAWTPRPVTTRRAVYVPGATRGRPRRLQRPDSPTRPSLTRTAGWPGASRSTRASASGRRAERERDRRPRGHGGRRSGEAAAPSGRRASRRSGRGRRARRTRSEERRRGTARITPLFRHVDQSSVNPCRRSCAERRDGRTFSPAPYSSTR